MSTLVSCQSLRVQGTSLLASSWTTLEKPRSEQKWPLPITPIKQQQKQKTKKYRYRNNKVGIILSQKKDFSLLQREA